MESVESESAGDTDTEQMATLYYTCGQQSEGGPAYGDKS